VFNTQQSQWNKAIESAVQCYKRSPTRWWQQTTIDHDNKLFSELVITEPCRPAGIP